MFSEKDQLFAEYQILDPAEPGVIKAANYLQGLLRHVLPNHDWVNQPFEILISDTPSINAEAKIEGDIPRIIVMKELVAFMQWVDEMTFILTHEAGHKDFFERYRLIQNSNPEEMSADRFAIERMAAASPPLSWQGSVQFFQRIAALKEKIKAAGPQANPVEEAIRRSLDVHLANDDRIKFFTMLAGSKSLGEGIPLPNPALTPFPEEIKTALHGVRHVSLYEKICTREVFAGKSAEEQLGLLEQFIRHPVFAHAYPAVLEDFQQYVTHLKIDPKNKLHMERVHHLVRQAWDGISHPKTQEQIYKWFLRHVEPSTGERVAPLGYFHDLDQAIYRFANTKTAGDAEQTAIEIMALHEKLYNHFSDRYSSRESGHLGIYKTELGNRIRLHDFEFARTLNLLLSGIKLDLHPVEVPYLQHLEFIDKEHPHVARALWLLGVNHEQELWKRLDDEALAALGKLRPISRFSGNWAHVTAFSKEFGDAIDGRWPVFEPNTLLTRLLGFIDERRYGNAVPFSAPEAEWQTYYTRNNAVLKLKLGDKAKQTEFTLQAEAALQGPDAQAVIVRVQALFKHLMGTSTTRGAVLGVEHPYIVFLIKHAAVPEFKETLRDMLKDFLSSSYVTDSFNETIRNIFDIPKAATMNDFERNLRIWKTLGYMPRYEVLNFVLTQPSIPLDTLDGQRFIRLLREFGYHDDKLDEAIDPIREKLWARDFLDEYKFDPAKFPSSSVEMLPVYMTMEERKLFPNENYRAAMAKLAIATLLKDEDSWEKDRLLLHEIIFPYHSTRNYHPDFVKAAMTAYIEARVREFGADDESAIYRERFIQYVKGQLIAKASTDRAVNHKLVMEILDRLTKGISAQPALCEDLARLIHETHVNTMGAYNMAIVGAKALGEFAKKHEEIRLAGIDFLAAPLSKASLEQMVSVVKKHRQVEQRILLDLGRSDNLPGGQGWGELHADLFMTTYFNDMHKGFWGLQSRERLAVMDNLLIPANELLKGDKAAQEAFDKAFILVAAKLFPAGNLDNEIAVDFVKHFLKEALPEERSLLLAGLMASAEQSDKVTRTGEKLRVVFSVMGPAYVKLGQQLGSFLGTRQEPEARIMAKDLAGLKSEAQPEPLWEYYPRLLRTLPQEIARNIVRFVGELGSASINKSFQVLMRGENGAAVDKAVLLERENALPLANAGFNHIQRTLQACEHPFWNEHRDTAMGLVEETRKTFANEVDIQVFGKQLDHSQDIYAGRTIRIGRGQSRFHISLRPVGADAYGMDDKKIGFKVLDYAAGLHFDELPENTAWERLTKQTVARAYATFELSRILSGKIFDSDRHGRQMRVLVHGRRIILNLFDYGCMLVNPPDRFQQKQLADAVMYIVKGQLNKLHDGRAVSSNPQQALTDYINAEEKAGRDTSFLCTSRRGIIALGDYFRHITPEEARNVFETALKESRNPLILQGVKALAVQGKNLLALAKTYAGWMVKEVIKGRAQYSVSVERRQDQEKRPPVVYIGQQKQNFVSIPLREDVAVRDRRAKLALAAS
jgi:hypothetical protein